jgi:hypothetical protein
MPDEGGLVISSSGSWQGEMSVRSPANVAAEEPDNMPSSTSTTASSLFQGLKLGRAAQGFRRFN